MSFMRLPVSRCLSLVALAAAAGPLAAEESAAPGKILILPPPDLAQIELEDAKRSGGAFRYGVLVPVHLPALAPGEDAGGRWSPMKGGRLRWSRSLAAPGARSIDLHFSQLQLPTGAELHLVGEGEGNRRVIRADELAGNGAFHSPYVLGERVRLEVIVPAALRDQVRLRLAHATHGYRGLFERDSLEKSGSCNVDVACPAGTGWDDQIDAVGHYTFSDGASSYVCTGTLMANTASTATPYFLTANHCMSAQATASTIVVYWNYQSATCRTPGSASSGTPLSRTIATHNQSGSTLVATNAASDFTLLRLNSNVPAGADAFFSGWDATGATPTSAAGIHHPAGHEKRIAIDSDALQVTGYGGGAGSTHWRIVDWNEGTTEGGSSGSGLWNQNKRLVGQLHGGSAACGNDLSDYYGRLSVSWTGGGTAATRLRDHLDPGNTATSIPGYRTPGSGGNVAPVANFSFVVAGLGATFTDSSTDSDGSIASRSWTFGDGGTSSAANPVRAYVAPGTYTVTLTVTDNGGLTHSTSKSVTVAASIDTVFRSGFENAGSASQTYGNATDVAISDGATSDSPIAVAGRTGNAPANASVSVDIVHTYQGDLRVDLVAPDGTLYNIHDRSGGGTDNLVRTVNFDLSSESLNGTWTLRVFDGGGGDVGYINSWSITF
jgi:lysyl endopeptidase